MTPWTVVCQAPLSMGFSKQEYWSGLPFPFPGDLPDPRIKPGSPALHADTLPTELQGKLSNITLAVVLCLFLFVFYKNFSSDQGSYLLFLACWELWSGMDVGFSFWVFFILFLVALGLGCWIGFSLVAVSGRYCLVMVCGVLIAMDSLVEEHGSRARGLQ